jgi:hypothetical protein
MSIWSSPTRYSSWMSSERLRTSGYTQTIPVPLHLEHDGLSLSHPSLLSRQRWQEDLLDVGRAVMVSAGTQDQERCGRQPACFLKVTPLSGSTFSSTSGSHLYYESLLKNGRSQATGSRGLDASKHRNSVSLRHISPVGETTMRSAGRSLFDT